MAIEFRCTKCNKLLRTADNTAGKHARCPECGEVLAIPAGGATFTPPATPPSTPPPTPPSASPFSSPLPSAGGGGFSPPPPSGPTGGSPFGTGQQPEYQPDTGNPYQSPSAYATMPTSPAAAAEIRPTIIDLGDVMGRSWRIFKEQWGIVLGVVAIIFFCNLVIGQIPNVISIVVHDRDVAAILALLVNIAAQIFSLWIGIGQTRILLKVARGQQVDMAELFSGGPYFLRILGASILFGLMVFFGFILLIVPGIILSLMFSQYYYLIIDRNLGVMDSLNLAKEITTGNKMTLFLIGLVCMGISFATIVTCFTGLIVAVPYFALLNVVIYLSMTGQPTVDQMRAQMGIQ